MKAHAKRLLGRAGRALRTDTDRVGFFDLWRYAEAVEVCASAAACALAGACACALLGAVLAYGELTALFVARSGAAPAPPHARLLTLFAGGERLREGGREAHMDALVRDSAAFAAVSALIMGAQLLAAAAALALADWAADRMVTRLRLRLLSSVVCREMAFFDADKTTNFAATLTGDMEKLRAGVGAHVVMTAYLGGSAACGVGLALFYGWRLALAALVFVPLSALVAALAAKKQSACAAREGAAYGAAGRVVQEALGGVRTVRAYAGEDGEAARYRAALAPAARAARARSLWAAAGAGLGWLLTYALNAVVFAYGAALVVDDMHLPPDERTYHPGVTVTVLFCTFIAAQNVTMCHPHLETFSAATGAARSVYELLERRPRGRTGGGGGARPDALRGDVRFDDVRFAYPSRSDAKVLRGFTLTVNAGETVALVGGSGSGKSTVLQLLQGAYSPDAGEISVDGRPLRDLDLRHFRSKIGVVGQEPVLFAGTVRENIALGAGDVTDDEIVAAAKTADAHEFVLRLPRGYETAVGAGGAALSGGQKQRLAIARALVRRPALLLLDEPTSALDPAAERAVQAALDAASAGRTTLVVSHRLHTVRRATRIVVVHDGAVLEHGSHDELLARRAAYWRLLNADLGAPAAPDDARADGEPPAEPDLRRSVSRRSTSTIGGSAATRGSVRLGAVPTPARAGPEAAVQETAAEEDEEPAVSSVRLLRLHAPEWHLVALGALASLLVGATMPIFAFLFSKLYGMFSWSDGEAILAQSRLYAVAFAAVAALCGLVTFLQTWLFNAAGARLTDRLRDLVFRNYLRQDQTWFDEPANSVGALCARLATDCAAVQGATGTRLGTVLQGVSTMVLGVGLALAYSWKMTLVSLLSVPCVVGGIRLEGRASRRAERRARRSLEDAARVATEAVLHVRTVQSLGAERELVTRYGAALAAGGGGGAARAARALSYGVCLCAPTLGYAVSLAYGGYLIAREGLPYEYAILVSEALVYGAWMLAEALSFAPSFGAARRAGARILAALAHEPAIASDAVDDPAWRAEGSLRFDDVEFSRGGRAVLRGVSLHAGAGRTLALVGRSGCGKSTLLQLALRTYEARAGAVSLDGRDVRALAPPQLRRQAALVQQEPVLFARTVRENIAYGAEARHATMADVVRAAEQADVHSFVSALPLGYETEVSGASLSGGQKQRVCIARALLRQPRLLLLDEATSALDAASERAVHAALRRAAAGRTTVLVAHRLATVRHAHTIAVIDDGLVAESGSHEELEARRGLYWRLLRQQAAHTA